MSRLQDLRATVRAAAKVASNVFSVNVPLSSLPVAPRTTFPALGTLPNVFKPGTTEKIINRVDEQLEKQGETHNKILTVDLGSGKEQYDLSTTPKTAQELRLIMRKVPQPVVVITTSTPTQNRGATVSSFTSLTLHPIPLISFSLRTPSRLSTLLHSSHHFIAHVLSRSQMAASVAFSTPNEPGDQFDDIPHYIDPISRIPVLIGCVGAMVCKVEGVIRAGDHEVWIGEVKKVIEDEGEEALLFYQRGYRSIGEEVFMEAFEDLTLEFKRWTHKAHVRMAWNYIREKGENEATPLIKQGIQKYNAANASKVHTGYHETITSFFIKMISKAIESELNQQIGTINNYDDDFSAFVERYPKLNQRGWIYEYYSRELLNSEEARKGFVEPDLKPFPMRLEPAT